MLITITKITIIIHDVCHQPHMSYDVWSNHKEYTSQDHLELESRKQVSGHTG